MPSYLGQDNIGAAQPTVVQPAMANIDAIARTFQTKVQYWAQGASQVKSAYQNYLNLDLTREDNQKNLNSFMQGANEQLKKAATTDLSVGDNREDALGIFKPLTDARNPIAANIMGDNAITRHYRDQIGIAESYRNRDGGKEFSATNLQAVQMGLNDFRNDNDAANWKTHYATREYYTPYYDVNKEIMDLRKNFVPSSSDMTAPFAEPIMDKSGKIKGYRDTSYLKHVKDASTTAAQWKLYLDSNLSDKAKNQLGINAKVAYSNDLNAISSDYVDYAVERAKAKDEQIGRIDGLIASPATSNELKKTLQTQKQTILDSKASLLSEIDQIRGGNLDFIKTNKNMLAKRMFTDKYLNSVATGLAYTDQVVEYKPDQVKLAYMHESMENSRFNIAQQGEWNRAKLSSDTQLAVAMIRSRKPGATLRDVPTENVNSQSGFTDNSADQFDNDLVNTQNKLKSTEQDLIKKLTANDSTFSKLTKPGQDTYISSWKAQQQSLRSRGLRTDPLYDDYDHSHTVLQLDLDTKNKTKEYVENFLKQKYGPQYDDYVKVLEEQKKQGNYSDDPNVDPLQALKLGIKTRSTLTFNNAQTKIDEERAALYGKNYVNYNTYQRAVDPNSALVKDTRENIANRLGLKTDEVGEIRWDGLGNIKVNFKKDSHGNDIDAQKMALRYGASAVQTPDSEGYITLKDISSFTTASKNPILRSLNDNMNMQIAASGIGTTPKGLWEPLNNGEFFRIRNSGTVENPKYMLIYEDRNTGADVPIYGATATSIEEIADKAKAIAVNPSRYISTKK